MKTVTIKLTDGLNRFLEQAIRAGGYSNASQFFASFLSKLETQCEAAEKQRKENLSSLRRDIQHAADQLDRGEGIRDFDYNVFLAERKQSLPPSKERIYKGWRVRVNYVPIDPKEAKRREEEVARILADAALQRKSGA